MSVNPGMLTRVYAPPESTQRLESNPIHTSTSSWNAQPSVLQTNLSNDASMIVPDKATSNVAEDSRCTIVTSEEHINGSRNEKVQSDLSPSQPSVGVNGEITNPTASGIERDTSRETRGTAKNDEATDPITIKAIREEERAASELLKAKMRELQCLKQIDRQLEKDESSAFSGHREAMQAEHGTGLALLAAKARHESALIDLSSKESRLKTSRERALQQHELLRQKQEEVEELKKRKETEDRERRLRIKSLKKSSLF